jgi:hypothetical protein
MGTTLILWKAPLVPDSCAAEVLLRRWYKRRDDGDLDPSESIADFADALVERHPPSGRWAEFPFVQTDRILEISLHSGPDPQLIADICDLALEHGLMVYEPESGAIFLPRDPAEAEKLPRPRAGDWIRSILMAAGIVGATCLAWLIPIDWLRWPLVALGAFFSIAALVVVWAMIAGALGLLGGKQEAAPS